MLNNVLSLQLFIADSSFGMRIDGESGKLRVNSLCLLRACLFNGVVLELLKI